MGTQIIIGIPGTWPNLEDLFDTVSRKAPGYRLTDDRLTETATGKSWAAEIYEYDHDLVETFEIVAQPWIDEDMERSIALHTYAVYLLSSGLSLGAAREILDAGRALLSAGGLGVKMESTGLIHSAQRWSEFSGSASDPLQLYSCFVTLVNGSTALYSCGMHNLGLPDASIDAQPDVETAAKLVNGFNCMQLAGPGGLDDGDTFLLKPGERSFRLSKRGCTYDDLDHPFHNPFGVWHMSESE
jgi:hypothetical protein